MVQGEFEQTREPAAAVASNTRLLRSRRNEDVSKQAPTAVKRRQTAVSTSTSVMPADDNDTVTTQQVSTRPSDGSESSIRHRHQSQSTLRTIPVKSTVGETSAVSSSGRSSSLKSSPSAVGRQVGSKTRTVRADAGRSQNSQSSRTITSSPMSTRSRSSASSSPVKSSRHSRTSTSRNLPWVKKASLITYQRKHRYRNPQTAHYLRSTVSCLDLSTTADVESGAKKCGRPLKVDVQSGPKKRGRPRKVDKIRVPDSSKSKISSALSSTAESETETVVRERSPRRRRDVAVQADSHSSASSPRLRHHASLHSTASSLASTPSRRPTNVAMESCSTTKTAVTAMTSVQYDTCFESASSSQLQSAEDIDDEEIDRLARLAHGSPQSTVVPPCVENENVANHTDVEAEETISGDKPSTVHTRRAAAVADGTSDGSLDVLHESVGSGRSSSARKRRTEVDRMEETEQSPKSSRATSQLAVDGGKKLVKSTSGTDNVTAASSSHHSNVGLGKTSGMEVSSSLVEKSSEEPVAGPSGIAPTMTRSQNISKEKSYPPGED